MMQTCRVGHSIYVIGLLFATATITAAAAAFSQIGKHDSIVVSVFGRFSLCVSVRAYRQPLTKAITD